ncbi:MAG: hypothetical protein P8K76_02090 [Candidatus Binatia bacterium]|nr:hypothetical protein [Candidatus Binatia bacterium]MDG2008549.1 hypothetical protein [Candidatus Binatia bacterium]
MRKGFGNGTMLLLLAVAISGCASRYSKPGGSYQEYLETRHQCLQENMMRYSELGIYINSDFGSAGSKQTSCLNGGMFASCMAVKGWIRDSEGFAPPGGGVSVCPGT